MQVSLHNVVLIRVEIFQASSQEDATTLRSRLWLGDKGLTVGLPTLFCLIPELFLEFTKLRRQKPCLWEEFVFFGVYIRHSLKVSREVVFSSQCVHAWKVIDALVGLHSVEFVNLHSAIGP